MNAKKGTVLGTEDQPLGISHGGQQIYVVKPEGNEPRRYTGDLTEPTLGGGPIKSGLSRKLGGTRLVSKR